MTDHRSDAAGLLTTYSRRYAPLHPPPPLAYGFPTAMWHRWFAWRPIRTWDHRLVWLRFVYRRPIQKHDWLDFYGIDMWWWQHAL